MLDTEEKYGGSRHTKRYPKRKLLPEFDDEALEPIQPKNKTADQPDRPPRGRDRAANNVGMTRSMYGSRKRAPAHNQNRTLQPSECHDTSKYRGAAHPLCFTDEVLDHEFPEGFKPVNIEAYNGMIDPGSGLRTSSSISIWLTETISTPSSTCPSS